MASKLSKTAENVSGPKGEELVDTAVQNFWSRILPAEGAEKQWLHVPAGKQYAHATYRDINAQAHCVAAYLMRKGVRKGDVVGIIADQGPFYLAVDLGLQFLGAVNLTLPENVTLDSLLTLAEKPGMQFIFIQKESVFLALDQLREVKPLLREIILHTEEVESLEPEAIVTWDVIVNHGKVAWREYADQLRVMKSSVVPTDVYALQLRKEFNKLDSISFSDFLRDLDEALAWYSANGCKNILSMQFPWSRMERSYGLFGPLLLGVQVWCLPPGTSDLSARIRTIAPDGAVTSPESLARIQQELVMTHLSAEGQPRKNLMRAMQICDRRLRFLSEGKKVPLITRLQYWWLGKTLFKRIRGILGGRLKDIICDAGPVDSMTFAFFRNAGFPLHRAGKGN